MKPEDRKVKVAEPAVKVGLSRCAALELSMAMRESKVEASRECLFREEASGTSYEDLDSSFL